MKLKKMIVMLGALILCATHAYAGQGKSNERTYKNGFFVGIGGVGVPGAPCTGFGYYFGRNNCMDVHFAVAPYQSTNNIFGIPTNDTWQTSIAAGMSNFISVAREKLKNKFFFENGLDWAQTFGKSQLNDLSISSSWYVGYRTGAQYRLNPKVYIGFTIPVVGYSQTIYSLPALRQFIEKQYSWTVLSNPSVYMLYMF